MSQGTQLAQFRARQQFALDPFQVAACEALEGGQNVLVAAPTGAGKTIVGEFAIALAMSTPGGKAFYTTPMKALSNQKFRELIDVHGADAVGLLTGDTNINGNARVVVMTTEVLRNMLYADSDALTNLQYVVMDEVHYLADRFRGAVWEEVIIHLPASVRVVALSATVSNAEEFGEWIAAVRGNTEVIVSETRPVPLEQHVLVRDDLLPLFDESVGAAAARVNQALMRVRSKHGQDFERRRPVKGQRRPVRSANRQRVERMNRPEVVRLLDRANLLPAIFFIFSRVGCEAAVQQCRRAGLDLTSPEERKEIRAVATARTASLDPDDLGVLGYWDWLSNLERGVAAHHAGMLPVFKEVVETLYQAKLVKVVFATETLALGINMPARTVVLEQMEKFNGEARVPITSGEYTQLTGRAGRRGIDVEGHAVIQWTEGLDPQAVASLASRRTYPLNSSFRPTYNMAVNLVDQFGRDRAREILESSFAQFQADRSVVSLARQVKEAEQSLVGYDQAMSCELGDFAEYARLRREVSDLEKKLKSDGRAPEHVNRKRHKRIVALREQLRQHPVHACPDREDHARWGERFFKLDRTTRKLRQQIASRTGTVARVFDRVLGVLSDLDYVEGSGDELTLTDAGRTMRRIYGERDLLVAESLRRGLWHGLDPAALAAMAACLVYEPRRDEATVGERGVRQEAFRTALKHTRALWEELNDLELSHGLDGTAPIADGLSPAMYAWARGLPLDRVLADADMAAGDFVRWSKQTIDLLDQLSVVADDATVAANARKALDLVRRGVVAYSGL